NPASGSALCENEPNDRRQPGLPKRTQRSARCLPERSQSSTTGVMDFGLSAFAALRPSPGMTPIVFSLFSVSPQGCTPELVSLFSIVSIVSVSQVGVHLRARLSDRFLYCHCILLPAVARMSEATCGTAAPGISLRSSELHHARGPLLFAMRHCYSSCSPASLIAKPGVPGLREGAQSGLQG